MKALQFGATGSLDALKLVERPRPQPAAGEALVQVHAAGLNPSDVKNVLGRFAAYTTLPRVPGRDFSGVVIAGPSEWVGRAVWGTGRDLGFFHDGSHAECLTLPTSGLAEKPTSLSHTQAASCGVPLTTALDALDRTNVQAGMRLLVIGAGAVGDFSIQIAQARHAQVLVAVRRAEQAAALQQRGIETVLLTDEPKLAASVKAHFPKGADVIFDTTGFWLAAAVEALAPMGRIAIIAAPASGKVEVPTLDLYRRGGSLIGINTLLHDNAACAQMLDRMTPLFDRGTLRAPQRLREVPLCEGLAAYQQVNSGASDKVVLITTAATSP